MLLFSCCAHANDFEKLHEGDIIFQTSRSAQSKAIQISTGSKLSHVGLVFKRNGKLSVLEAVQPVKYTKIEDWINRGENHDYTVMRIKNADKLLTDKVLLKLKKEAESFLGKSYDLSFGWTDDKIYCSELVWKSYKRATGLELGHLQKLSDLNLDSSIVKKKIIERYGKSVPFNQPIISPAQIANSDLLFNP